MPPPATALAVHTTLMPPAVLSLSVPGPALGPRRETQGALPGRPVGPWVFIVESRAQSLPLAEGKRQRLSLGTGCL